MASDTNSLESVAQPQSRVSDWSQVAWFGLLLVLGYAVVLYRLIGQWYNNADMGHGFFVPLVAAYIAWQRRDQLLACDAVPNRWGLLVVAYGAAQLMVATLGAELFLARTAFIISLAGVILYLGGTRRFKLLAYSLFLLFFMVPIPAVIYNQLTFPLQLLATRLAETALGWLGIPVFREGNILDLANQRLSVVEACSGIRSLLSLSFLSLVYAFFFDSKVWMRTVLLVSTVPIAIIANAFRVTITGVLSTIRPDLAEGFFHSVEGWAIFMVALLILMLVHQVINRIYGVWHARH
jgi:exosortase